MIEIQVNSGLLDVYENTESLFYITIQAHDLRSLQSRNAEFTRVLDLPLTDNNKELLDLQENERFSNKFYDCNISIDGILILGFASLSIAEITQGNFQAVIYGGSFQLFNLLSDESIRALDWSGYNFTFDKPTIAGKVNSLDGVVFARHSCFVEDELFELDATAEQATADNTDIKNTGFFFYCKTILKEIIQQSGLIFNDNGLSNYSDYDELAVYCPMWVAVEQDDISTAKGAQAGKTTQYSHSGNSLGLNGLVAWETALVDPDGLVDLVNERININTTNNYRIFVDYNVDYYGNASQGPAIMYLYLNGTTILKNVAFNTQGFGLTGVLEYEGLLNSGDYVEVQVFASYRNSNRFDTIDVNTSSTFTTLELVGVESTIDVASWLPDISQKQFFLSILKFFNALTGLLPVSKDVVFVTYNDLEYLQGRDITENIDRINSTEFSIRYFKRSLMDYTNDTLKNQETAKIVEFTNDETLDPYGDLVTLPFSGSDVSTNYDSLLANQNPERINIPAYSVDIWTEPGFTIANGTSTFSFANEPKIQPGDYIYFNGLIYRVASYGVLVGQFYITYTGVAQNGIDVTIIRFRANSHTARLALVNHSKTTNHNFVINGYPDPTPTAVTMFEAEFTNITFEDLYQKYYQEMLQTLQTAKMITVWCRFSAYDISEINLLRPVYAKQLNGNFFINKIIQWKKDNLCLVELVRIDRLI